jgi:hypothetical protein
MVDTIDEALQACFKDAQWLAFYKAELSFINL